MTPDWKTASHAGGVPVIVYVTEPRPHDLVAGMQDGCLLFSRSGMGRCVAAMSKLRDARTMSGVVLVALPTEGEALARMATRVCRLCELRETNVPRDAPPSSVVAAVIGCDAGASGTQCESLQSIETLSEGQFIRHGRSVHPARLRGSGARRAEPIRHVHSIRGRAAARPYGDVGPRSPVRTEHDRQGRAVEVPRSV